MERKYLILACFAGFIICLDQATKLYIHTQFGLGDTVSVIGNYFNITYVRNTGAAFGIFRDSHETFRSLFFLLMPPLAVVVILALLKGVDNSDIAQIGALSSVFGGAIGNYIDRLRLGFVVDFLDFHYRNSYSWPAFNVADISIVSGVSVLFLLMLLEKRQKGPATSSPLTASAKKGE